MSGKEKLLGLEKTGKYVFHGSPYGEIEVFEPKQGTHIPDRNKSAEAIFDGLPAVSATPYTEFAIFRAIINKKNISFDLTSGFGFRNGKKEFNISSKNVLEEAKGKKGYVYIFNKDDFEPYSRDGHAHGGSMEWRSYKQVKPVGVIEVDSSGLVSEEFIEIIENNN